MKSFIGIGLLYCAVATTSAQTLSPSVVASGGAFYSTSIGSLSLTIGEVAATTLTSAANILTQGFQQPEFKRLDVRDEIPASNEVITYPNPSSQAVMLRIVSRDLISMCVFNALGQEIPSERLLNEGRDVRTLDVSRLAPGRYTLEASLHDGNGIRIVRKAFLVTH